MPEPLSGPWPEQLEALLERLRQDGFRVGVAETLRVHQLLLALVERGVPLDSPERLARLLGPVLCRSAREQETIQRHLAEWWPGPVVVEPEPLKSPQPLKSPPPPQLRPEPLSGPAAELDAALRRVERHRQGVLRWLPTTPLALGLTAALAAAGWVGLVELRQRLSPEPPARLEQPVAAPAPPPVKPPPLPRPQPPLESIAPARDPAPWPGSKPKPSKSIPPALASDNGLFLLPGELALLLGVGLLASLLAVQGAVRGWWWVQAWLLLERLPLRGDPELHRLSLGELERQLVALPEAHRIGRALNVWQRLPSEELDGAATVEASLRAGGWLSPRYGQRRQRQSYLFLLEQKSLADQQTRHLRAWLEGLDREGVLVKWECFQREPLVCQGPEGHGPRRRLAELVARHSEALVVVVADGERLFSPVDGAPRPWLRRLAVWPRQVVLTPRPRERWGVLEAELAQQLPVLPATPEGLLELGRWLREDPSLPLAAVTTAATLAAEPADPADHPIEPPEPPLLQGSATPWLERSPPAPAVVRELLAQLRSHLGPEGFYWLAACAVFPELHWTITLHLGQRLRGADGQPLPRHCPLPRLARLPWLRHGHLPDWLRLVLIQTLTPVQEAAVREVLTILLLAVVPQPAEGEEKGEVGEAELRVATELLQRLPRLLPPLLPLLLERLRRRAGPLSPLRDQLFLRFLRRRPLLAADAPESLRSLLRERPSQRPSERWWHRPRPWRKESEASAGGSWRVRELAVAGLLLLVLGGLGLVALREAQRAWIERLLRAPNAPAVSDADTIPRLRRAVTALGLSRSSLMRLGPDPELGRVEEALGRASETPGPRRANLRGHEGWVRSVAFSPDGSRIVSAGRDGTVRQWEVASGREIGAPLTGHQGVVLSAAYNAEGSRIVSAGEDGTLRLWDARSGTAIGAPLRGHEGWVRSAAFSPDGSRIVSAGRDGTVRLWDARSVKGIGEPLRSNQGALLSAAFNADGSRIVSAGEDGTLLLWDARSGTAIGAPLRGHEGWVRSAAFSPDGSRIVSAGQDGVVRLRDARSGREVGAPLRGHEGALLSAAFSADGSRIVSAGEDGTVRLWDARSGTAIGAPLRGHEGWVSAAVFSPDGSWIVSAGADGIVRLWGLSSTPAKPLAADAKGRATPDWRRSLPLACDKLELSPELTRLPWLNTARATCQHFVWSRRRHQSLEPWTGVA
ncbi:MAG: WD40 repeat domain-containing protein, partial [Cyanobacteriota bacterium]|nr:WD40 repeat domain-containing protein [Cyanobacteriota bacterium]